MSKSELKRLAIQKKQDTTSIDTPEFRELLQDYVIRTPNGRTALIAHIDTKIAEAVKEAEKRTADLVLTLTARESHE